MKCSLLVSICVALGLSGAAASEDAGRPLYGDSGFDMAAMNRTVRPGDDFFDYVNGTWIAHASIPADRSYVTRRLEMTERTEARLHDILAAVAAAAAHQPRDLSGKIGAFYKAFMDEQRIEGLAATPLKPEIAAVTASRSRAAVAALMGRNNEDFEGTLFAVYIDVDRKDARRYAVYLSQDGLGLPDRDYYLEEKFRPQKTAYQAYAAQLLGLLHWQDPQRRAQEIVELETQIAGASWTKVQSRDVEATYNKLTIAQLEKLAPGFAWKGYLAAARVGAVDHVIVRELTAFPKLAAIFAQTPLPTLQAWQAFAIADNAAPYLSTPFTAAWFELHQRTLAGQGQQSARWMRALTAVGGDDYLAGERFGRFGNMGWGVGQLYSARYFPPEAKTKIEQLVKEVVASYRARLERLDWMGTDTKAEALRKLDTYTVKVGYPDHPRDYTTLLITDNDLVGDVRRAAAADWDFHLHRLAGPVDRSDWGMTPQTNDAYNGHLRDIVFPAGILQPPIFDPNADPAFNYGAIGAVIGHELTHGFDDQGRKIDAAGELRDWWTADDDTKFKARAERLGAQYSLFQPLPGEAATHVNGALTMGENIADLGGLEIALDAYRASLHGQPAPEIDGFSGDQRVFLGWAQAWCGKVTDDFVRKQVVSDPHSPRQFRVNGVVRNIDAWYATFDVRPGDRLYVAPQERVRIW
jgi:putative endopeptidase